MIAIYFDFRQQLYKISLGIKLSNKSIIWLILTKIKVSHDTDIYIYH